jgi:hypothetical protein
LGLLSPEGVLFTEGTTVAKPKKTGRQGLSRLETTVVPMGNVGG